MATSTVIEYLITFVSVIIAIGILYKYFPFLIGFVKQVMAYILLGMAKTIAEVSGG